VHLLDYFSDKDITDNSTLVTATIVKSFCLPRVGCLTGAFSATALGGNAEFNALNAFCYPGGNMTLKYILLISLMLHLRASRNEGIALRSQIITRYLILLFFLTYLVLPSTSTTIFGAITCRSIDPENLVPGTPKYLRNDLSISCSSSRYHFGVHWAIAMIFVYPIGITCMFAYVLYVNREDVINQQETDNQVVDPIPFPPQTIIRAL
jgi:hypothetical protein